MRVFIFFTSAIIFFISNSVKSQEKELYSFSSEINIKEIRDVEYTISFKKEGDVLTSGPIIPLIKKTLPSLLRFLPKLFYNPSKYISENQAEYNFYVNRSEHNSLNENYNVEFNINGNNDENQNIEIGKFIFDIGQHNQYEGYYYIGLTQYKMNFTSVKLKPKSHSIHTIIEILFEYYDEMDSKKNFVLEPFYLDNLLIPSEKVLNNVDYQLLPKMKVLESMSIKITEVNAKKQEWDKWLQLFEKHQGQLPSIFK